jgi:hypothetical protein
MHCALTNEANLAQAAERILSTLRSSRKTELREILASYDACITAYVALANVNGREFHSRPSSIIPFTALATHAARYFERSQACSGIAILTHPPSPHMSCQYPDIVQPLLFGKGFTLTESGIHRPKILLCTGSDGRTYKQLVKVRSSECQYA